jgi:hypothetical protein
MWVSGPGLGKTPTIGPASHSAGSQPRNLENPEKIQLCIVFYITLATFVRIFQIPETRKILLKCCKILYIFHIFPDFLGFGLPNLMNLSGAWTHAQLNLTIVSSSSSDARFER